MHVQTQSVTVMTPRREVRATIADAGLPVPHRADL